MNFINSYDMLDLSGVQSIAEKIASTVKVGDVICLKGDLGVGKTQFAKFFIQALNNTEVEVSSPTFNLVQIYESRVGDIWHFDLYRLTKAEEIYEIGLQQALDYGISLIEWPQIAQDLLPKSCLEINLSFNKDNENYRDINLIRG
jgi:tRNA threonylcarbamoyladenosine biosynthesis protein TsaE